MRKVLLFAAALAALGDVFAGTVFRVTPYVQHPKPDAMSILWFCDAPGSATLSWWRADADESTAQSVEVTGAEAPALAVNPNHVALQAQYKFNHRITGLAADTAYRYKVVLAGDGGATYANIFRTAPTAFRPVRFVAYSDSETQTAPKTGAWEDWRVDQDDGSKTGSRKYYVSKEEGFASNVCAMASLKPDFVAVAGDLAGSGDTQDNWDQYWKHYAGALSDYAGATPILAAPGNHDYSGYDSKSDFGEMGMGKYLTYFEYEPNTANVDADQKQRFHRLDYGPVALIFIDPNNGPNYDPANTYDKWNLEYAKPNDRDTNQCLTEDVCRAPDFNPGSEQYKWIEEQLADAQTNKLFTFLVCHQCPYSIGYHGRRNGENEEYLSGVALRCYTNLVFKYGVDGWICGHDEICEHSRLTGVEELPDGTEKPTELHVYDVGYGGDDLRGARRTSEPNPYEVFRAHVDAPEVYDENGTLVSGGKHYGHLEVNVETNELGQWVCKLQQNYVFVSKDAQTGALSFDTRTYPDMVVLTNTTYTAAPPVEPPVSDYDYYVATSGNDENDGRSPATAFATIKAAVTAVGDGESVYIGEGEFALTETMTLDKDVKFVGAGSDKTVIKMPTMANFLSIDINHDDAVLEGIALTGIYFTSKPSGSADDGCYVSGQWKSPISVKVQKGTLKDSVIRDNYATLQYGTGPWLWMSGGRAENVKILDNYYNRTGNSVTGYAVYMKGNAVMENCEIARNGCPWEENGCIWMEGTAKMLHCDMHDNDGRAGNYHCGIYMNASGVLVEGCRIYGNNNGVYLGNGTLRNSLIYANRTKLVPSDATCYYAGVRQNGGTMQNCTIYGNVSPGAANGVGGLHMTGGTAENNIIYGNGGVRVTGGTFNNNLTDADAGRGSGNIIGDPEFADAANGDFRLGVGSLARDAGKAIAAVTNDFAGVARPQGAACDIGAFERPAAAELACGVAVGQVNWKAGSTPTVTASVEGTEAEASYQWFVDGVEIDDTTATPSLGELAVGSHTVKLVVTAGGSSAESTRTDAVCVQPLTNYVSATGSDTFPYDTEAKAAHKVADALAAVYGAADASGTVCIASGTYYLDTTLVVDKPVTLVGAGRDATFVSGGKIADTYSRGMNVGNAAATVKDLSFVGCTNIVRGSGIYMSAGTLDNVRVAWHRQNPNGNDERWGAGLYLTGGTVTNSVLERNYFNASYHGTRGGGVYMTGGLVTDCDICHNWMARNQHNGLGVWISGGTVRNCRIFDNYSTVNAAGGSGTENNASGHGVNMGGGVVENCLIFSNGWNGVMVRGGTLRNCAVFGHRKCTADYFAGVNISGGSVINCTIADNYAAADSNGKSGLWQTGGTVVNTIIYNNGISSLGSCQISGGTFKTNITDKVESEGGFVQDPKFVDPTGDFHLLTGSPAIDKAAPLLAYDLEGTARPQRKGWDIGCYELPPSTEKSVTIAADEIEGPAGKEIVAQANLENIDGDITYKWTLTDASGAVVALDEGGEGHETFTRKIDVAGGYSLALDVVADGVTYAAKETQAFTIKPSEVFVSLNGSDTAPYDTPEKATTNVNAALAALWQSADATSVVHVAEGTYYLTDQLMLTAPIRVLGAGRDLSVLNGSMIPDTTRGITMSHKDAVVRDLTLDGCTNRVVATGSGIRMENGLLANVRITRIRQQNIGEHQSACGLRLSGGTATNVVIDNCSIPSSYGNTQGIGAMVGGGLLVDSTVRDITLNRGELHGIGVNVTGGTVRRVKITNVRGNPASNTYGSGLYVGGSGTAEDCEIRGCLQGVCIDGGTLRNSLIAENDNNGSDKHAGGLWQAGGTVINCTCAGNVTTQADANSDLVATAGTTVNTIAIKANVTGGTRRNNCLNEEVSLKADYSLRTNASNCIDKGDNSVWDGFTDPKDLAGKPRILRKVVDIGCFECSQQSSMLMLR